MKRYLTACLLLALILCAFQASAQSDPAVFVNGKRLEAAPIVQNERIYIPLRAVGEALGAEVVWDGDAYAALITLDTVSQTIPAVLAQVSPSVVGVIGTVRADVEYVAGGTIEGVAHGSGVILKPSGEILTNAHVVKDMEVIVVVLSDGSGYTAELKHYDESSDLAVIKIQKSGLPAATFAKADDITAGETVIAVGTPLSFALQNSATAGIVSGFNRSAISDYYLIQTDAAINPGNSGGPLVNLRGEVIGINSLKFVGEGVESLNFSIPVSTVAFVLRHFETYGSVRRPNLGATFSEDWAAQAGLPTQNGLTVTSVVNGSAAEQAGLAAGDMLIAVDDVRVSSLVAWNECMKSYLPGDTVRLQIVTAGTAREVPVTLR